MCEKSPADYRVCAILMPLSAYITFEIIFYTERDLKNRFK